MIFATNEPYDVVVIFYIFVKYIIMYYNYTFDENRIQTFYTYVKNHNNSNLIHNEYNYYLFILFCFCFFLLQ